MAEAVMTLQYEGNAVDAGTMEVRQLAPALLATGEAIRQAHALLSLEGPAPQVEVRATRPGSFVIDLIVADLPLLRRMLDVFDNQSAVAAATLATLVTTFITSLTLISRLRGRKISRSEEIEPGRIRLILQDGVIIETTPDSLALAMDALYRRSVRRVVEPAAAEGIRSLTVSANGQSETVNSADVPAFDLPPTADEYLGESVSDVVLRPVNVAFAENNKWRFSDGESTFYASIDDAEFARKVEDGSERFAKNDLLRVELRARQTRDAGGTLHTDYAVIKVNQHIPGYRGVQLALFADIGETEADRSDAPADET
jgi:hypothetical protein